MIKFKIVILSMSCYTLLLSCNGPAQVTPVKLTGNVETIGVLQVSKLDISSKSYRTDDLVQAIYSDLVAEEKNLKILEENIEVCQSKSNDVGQDFLKYDNKSERYYKSASHYASRISDSLARKQILKLIAQSEHRFQNSTNEFQNLLKQISSNNTKLEEKHNILKIVLTLTEMEKFQKNSQSSKEPFHNLIKEQKNIIDQIEKATPKY